MDCAWARRHCDMDCAWGRRHCDMDCASAMTLVGKLRCGRRCDRVVAGYTPSPATTRSGSHSAARGPLPGGMYWVWRFRVVAGRAVGLVAAPDEDLLLRCRVGFLSSFFPDFPEDSFLLQTPEHTQQTQMPNIRSTARTEMKIIPDLSARSWSRASFSRSRKTAFSRSRKTARPSSSKPCCARGVRPGGGPWAESAGTTWSSWSSLRSSCAVGTRMKLWSSSSSCAVGTRMKEAGSFIVSRQPPGGFKTFTVAACDGP